MLNKEVPVKKRLIISRSKRIIGNEAAAARPMVRKKTAGELYAQKYNARFRTSSEYGKIVSIFNKYTACISGVTYNLELDKIFVQIYFEIPGKYSRRWVEVELDTTINTKRPVTLNGVLVALKKALFVEKFSGEYVIKIGRYTFDFTRLTTEGVRDFIMVLKSEETSNDRSWLGPMIDLLVTREEELTKEKKSKRFVESPKHLEMPDLEDGPEPETFRYRVPAPPRPEPGPGWTDLTMGDIHTAVKKMRVQAKKEGW